MKLKWKFKWSSQPEFLLALHIYIYLPHRSFLLSLITVFYSCFHVSSVKQTQRHLFMRFHNGSKHCPNNEASLLFYRGFPGGSVVMKLSANAGDAGSFPGLRRSTGEWNGNHSSILAWKIPWTEEPGGLQSMGSQKVGHGWATKQQQFL